MHRVGKEKEEGSHSDELVLLSCRGGGKEKKNPETLPFRQEGGKSPKASNFSRVGEGKRPAQEQKRSDPPWKSPEEEGKGSMMGQGRVAYQGKGEARVRREGGEEGGYP